MKENVSGTLSVAAVQFRSSYDIDDNLQRIGNHLTRLADQGVAVAAFPECAVTSYNATVIQKFTPDRLAAAECALSAMCRESGMHALVGMPYFEDGVLYNGALAWNPDGELIVRYAKIQLAENWCAPGERLLTFVVDGVTCGVIVCHDERYPELVRLQVLAGAQIVFYLSCESDVIHESKIEPYRVQIVARAQENSVYVVHANTPQSYVRAENDDIVLQAGCSHGQSRIITPAGHIVAEASIFEEEVIVAGLDLEKANRHLALRSLESSVTRDWWNAGMQLVEKGP